MTWYKDGRRLRSGEQVRIERMTSHDHVLALEYVTIADGGRYIVKAKNCAGEVSADALLNVEPRPSQGFHLLPSHPHFRCIVASQPIHRLFFFFLRRGSVLLKTIAFVELAPRHSHDDVTRRLLPGHRLAVATCGADSRGERTHDGEC